MYHNTIFSKQKTMQILQVALLAGGMLFLLFFTGFQILGTIGIIVLGAVFMVALFSTPRSVVPKIYKASRKLRYGDAPEIFGLVQNISKRAGLSFVPDLYYLRSPFMNAMTTGEREHASILITSGLLSRLTPREFSGVLAHEISHVRNSDLSLFRFTETVRNLTTIISRIGWLFVIFFFPIILLTGRELSPFLFLFLIGAPLLSLILNLALVRSREFGADLSASELTGDPEGLASALEKLEQPQMNYLSLFFPIVRQKQRSIFRTHPATEERVRRLRNFDL